MGKQMHGVNNNEGQDQSTVPPSDELWVICITNFFLL